MLESLAEFIWENIPRFDLFSMLEPGRVIKLSLYYL